jgi:SM-20-related protein
MSSPSGRSRVTDLKAMSEFPAADWQAVAHALTERGHVVVEAALPRACWTAMRSEAQGLLAEQAFSHGRIGHAGETHHEDLIRGDSLCWLDASMRAGGPYLRWMDTLRLSLNRSLFLGLSEFEAHYAHFPVGRFYRAHLDRYGDSNARVLSSVFYCNSDWPADAGGEFVIYDQHDRACVTLAPTGGTLVLFLSAGTRHEARPSTRPRWSVAGWFRTPT